MKLQNSKTSTAIRSAATFLLAVAACSVPFYGQSTEVQQKLAEVKQASAANKLALAQYSWQELQSTSVKGELKNQQIFLVRVGPDGQQQKTPISATPPPAPSGGRLKQHVVAKKTAEMKDYGGDIGALAKQYTQLDPSRLQAALQSGNVSAQLGGGDATMTLLIKNYIKPNDLLTLIFDKQQKAIQSVQVNSYLDSPSDAITISAQFARLPDGTNHVTGSQMNGASKQLSVTAENSNYQKL